MCWDVKQATNKPGKSAALCSTKSGCHFRVTCCGYPSLRSLLTPKTSLLHRYVCVDTLTHGQLVCARQAHRALLAECCITCVCLLLCRPSKSQSYSSLHDTLLFHIGTPCLYLNTLNTSVFQASPPTCDINKLCH